MFVEAKKPLSGEGSNLLKSMLIGPIRRLPSMVGFGHLDVDRREWMEGRKWRWLS